MLEIRQKPIESVGVAWWPGGRTAQNAAVAAALAQRGDGGQPGAGGEAGGLGRAGAEPGVGVDPSAAGRGDRVDAVEVPRRVDPLEVGPRAPATGSSGIERVGDAVDVGRRRSPPATAPDAPGGPGPVRCSRYAGWVANSTVTDVTIGRTRLMRPPRRQEAPACRTGYSPHNDATTVRGSEVLRLPAR